MWKSEVVDGVDGSLSSTSESDVEAAIRPSDGEGEFRPDEGDIVLVGLIPYDN